MLMSRRLEGHLVRVDVLCSALQKGIRRRDPTLTLWSVVLLCRGNLWKLAVERLMQSSVEECNAFAELNLRATLMRVCKRLVPQLERHGVNVSTDSTKKLIFELATELCFASKSRLSSNALVATYGSLAAEAKDIRDSLPSDSDECLIYLFKQFRKAYEMQEETATLKWLALLEMHGRDHVVYGIPKVWRFLQQNGKCADKVEELLEMIRKGYLSTEQGKRLALFEATLYAFYPLRPSKRSQESAAQWTEYWNKLWNAPLEPALRGWINWNVWLPVVLDLSTAGGKNRDTLGELQARYPEFPVNEYAAPDTGGLDHPSYIQHEFTVCAVLHSRLVSDPFETRARHFLANVERGHSLPILGKGVDNVSIDHTRTSLSRLLKPIIVAPESPLVRERSLTTGGALSARGTRKSTRQINEKNLRLNLLTGASPAGSQDNSEDSTPIVSQVDTVAAVPPVLQRPASADPVRSHAVSKAPCPLPGFLVNHQETLSGPCTLDDAAVTYCQLADLPRLGTHPRWFVGLQDRSCWIVQKCAEMTSTIPVYLDRIKGRFGLNPVGLRWSDPWLILRDLGKGGPYPVQTVGPKRHELVVWKEAHLTPLPECTDRYSDAVLEQLTRALLFRTIYRVRDTTLTHFVVTATRPKVYSLGEWSVSQSPVPELPSDVSDSSSWRLPVLLRSQGEFNIACLPGIPQVDWVTEYLNRPETAQKIVGWLDQWEGFAHELPAPHRPIADFPGATHLVRNIRTLRTYWTPRPVPPT